MGKTIKTEKKYGIIKPKFPRRELLVVPHKGKDLTVSFPVFGPNTDYENMKEMGKTYSHPINGKQITFRPATTSESISAIDYNHENWGRWVFSKGSLQVGYIVKTQDGIFTNTIERDESKLKQLLNNAKKTNKIYFLDDEIAFAPYDSFETKVQDQYIDAFVCGGLARALEHTVRGVASSLKRIVSLNKHEKTISVYGFDRVEEPILKIVGLDSTRSGVFDVFSINSDGYDDCCAFGVLDESAKNTGPEK